MTSHEFLQNTVIYLSAAITGVIIAYYLGLGSVLGYLVSGIVIGPDGLGLIHSPQDVLHFSEFGVVLLLFLIGLELNPRRLWSLRRPIFGMGGLQIMVTIPFLLGTGLALGLNSSSALVFSMGAAMSSTALALQLLRERNLHLIPVGESSFAVLLFQDLAVIPMLSILPLLSQFQSNTDKLSNFEKWLPLLKGALAVFCIVILGRYLVKPLFRIIANTRLRELFTAFSLALVFGVALLMEQVGLSMALGAFLAGVLLADSEFRHELEIDIEPFKGLLLGLFFIAVGMSMQLNVLKTSPALIFGLVFCLLAIKLSILYGIGILFKHTRSESQIFAIALCQGGEFAFVLFGIGKKLEILSPYQVGLFTLVVVISMGLTPFLFILHDRILRILAKRMPGFEDIEHQVQNQNTPVILAGYGRIGQVIGRFLHSQGIGLTILEKDPGQIQTLKRFGWKVFYGDVSRLDLLRAAGAEQARLLILAIDDMDATTRTIELVKEHFKNLKILVRAETRLDAYNFINLNVPVVRATFAPGLEMGEEALKLLDFPAFETRSIAQRFKRYDRSELFKSAQHSEDLQTLITLSAQSREELTRIMTTDDKKRREIAGDSWD
jgi:glutathione-regulated potassium-efflux system ancillary protein KefC